ncbi:cyclodeaminase/cyclohydrolase family protein [bacterium]|nr:cyclodeaminase/cyclohydrolase family protein [bacterium]
MKKDIKLSEFIESLSSEAHVPGGGSVASLAGCLGAGLVSMVGNLTKGKKNYENVSDDMERLLSEAKRLNSHLFDLITQDMQAFDDVMGAYKLPRETEEDKAVRDQAVQHALKKAAQVPFETMKSALGVLKLSIDAAEKGNKNLVSDAGVAAHMAWSAIRSAYYNVVINANSISDEGFVNQIKGDSDKMLTESDELLKKATQISGSKLRGE